MKRYIFFIGITCLWACEGNQQVIELENPLAIERTDEAFVLKAEQLYAPGDGYVAVLQDEAGADVPSQADDLDGDGQWDELAFVYTLKPNQKTSLKVKWVAEENAPVYPRRTNVRYGKMTTPGKIVELYRDAHGKYNLPRGEGYPYQMDGVAWENDKMGFRHYFDGRNCRDVFGKRVGDMVLDTVGIRPNGYPGDTYHVLADWGRDIMSAANSFGLGGLAILSQDSLIRLGVVIEERTDNVDSTSYELVVKGPVRSIFRLQFRGWEVKDTKLNIYETVTIWAGKYGYENRIETDGLPPQSMLVTGIVRSFNDNALVEKNIDNGCTIMMTHDKQTYNKEWYMGMALLIPEANVIETFDTLDKGEGIITTWCVKLKPDEDNRIHYNTYAAWELQDQRFTQSRFFFDLIEREAEKFNHPVKVTIHP